MRNIKFTAVSLCNEIDLNGIAKHFGIDKRFEWDEPLLLLQEKLKGIINMPEGKSVFIFSFGSMVFLNLEHHEIMDIIEYLQKIESRLVNTKFDFTDDFNIEVSPDKEPSISYDLMIIQHMEDFHLQIISTILAKSVALDRIEVGINKLMDDIEDIIDYLENGHLNISDERLAKISGKILGFKYNTISYVMLLDKPDVTWVNEESKELYIDLEKLFELRERYERVRHKTETLLDITDVFTGLAHARRSTRLEWMVIILIAAEILLTILSYIFGFGV
ncbi:RMD1 family protein [Calorimonas adulescens]|uniref:RMD1 family protein n=1 Tax=Calorimonas adulescens TaxID=2606906 RepID=A0A5D8QD02_9THEO|nr:RMD1 family protein [Calorimonas adulescens]TZE82287.1 RMD1 family protein [Calorimonas adulescens]